MKRAACVVVLAAVTASACGSGSSANDDPVKTLQDAELCTGFQSPKPEDEPTGGTTTECTFRYEGSDAVINVNFFSEKSQRDAYVQEASRPYSVVGADGKMWWSINLAVYGGAAAVDIPDRVTKAFPNNSVVR